MSITRLPRLPQIVKVLRPTVEETEEALHLSDAERPPWSYDRSWALAYPLFKGKLSLPAALAACNKEKNLRSRRCNAEVVSVIHSVAQRASYFCQPLKDRCYTIRYDLTIPVRPWFYLVRNGSIKIFWLQPWKTFDLSTEQLGVLASVIKQSFVVDEFESAGLHLIDTSAACAGGVRQARILGFKDLPMLSADALKDAFDRFALAWDRYAATRMPREERPRRPPEQPQQGQFDLD